MLSSADGIPPRVAIYARYSSDMQNPKSVDDQFRECRRHAERHGYQVVKEYADAGMSGALRDRPGYQELLAAVHNRLFDIVLIENIDLRLDFASGVAGDLVLCGLGLMW